MRAWIVTAALAAAGCAHMGGRSAPKGDADIAKAQLERLKSLEGTWTTVPGSAMQGSLEYRVVGNGSAVQETVFPGTSHEMITLYHLDGPSLVLTHYCAAGNQPRMRAVPSADTSTIRFDFAGLGNGNPSKDFHMHDATLEFKNDGHYVATWSSWENGAPAKFQAHLDLVRAPKL